MKSTTTTNRVSGNHTTTMDTPKSNKSSTSTNAQREVVVRHPADFKPYSVEDYRKMREKDQSSINKSKGLGPNDSDDVRKARELKKMAKEYGENNNKVNMTVLPFQPKTNQPPPGALAPPQMSEKVLEAKERMEKAKEFARNVPKPVVRDINAMMMTNGRNGGGGDGTDTPTARQYFMSPKQAAQHARRDRLLEMEAQHEQDRLMVENLKRQLKI